MTSCPNIRMHRPAHWANGGAGTYTLIFMDYSVYVWVSAIKSPKSGALSPPRSAKRACKKGLPILTLHPLDPLGAPAKAVLGVLKREKPGADPAKLPGAKN